jgi:superfamily II DNA/RNA helicase
VGRTARAGCGGRAVTLVTESMRLLMKQIVADVEDKSSIKSRVIPPGTAHPPFTPIYKNTLTLLCCKYHGSDLSPFSLPSFDDLID